MMSKTFAFNKIYEITKHLKFVKCERIVKKFFSNIVAE